jgi:hypothetical protein
MSTGNEIARSQSTRSGRRHEVKSGFALIITISLMVLLMVIGLGLLTLSAISMRSQRVTSANAEARANARLALLIAIGDLQRYAGPDQRITATADIAGSEDGDSLIAGQEPANAQALDGTSTGLGQVQPGTRYWTGVFSNRDDPSRIFKKTPAPRLERWLVSGYQDPNAASPAITPALAECAVAADGTVADSTKAAVLVGPATVGTGIDSRDQYVAAPMVSMDLGSTKGGFAYWIGDEGVKARINMERSLDRPDDYNSLVAQRRGWETVDGFADYPIPSGDGDRSLPGIVTVPSAELLLPTLGAGDPSPRQSVFHSATTTSRGLLVDTLNGGTRVDLTAVFSQGLPGNAPVGAYDNYPVAGGRVIPSSAHRNLRYLTWDHLQDFYNLGDQASNATLTVRSRSKPTEEAIAPIVTDFRILMGVRLESIDQRGRPTGRYKVYPCAKIAIAIANPYSLPLEWNQDLEFEVINQTPSGNRPSRIWQCNSDCVYIPGHGGEAAVFNQAVFRIKRGSLDPGEARAFTLAGNTVRDIRSATRRTTIDLAPFGSASPFDFNNCVEMRTNREVGLPFTMDVRESWQTTLAMLEMRLAGSRSSSSWLSRLERFELDNGYFAPNQRKFNSSHDRHFKRGPIPLMLYSFQVSQPGMDYLSLMPNGYEWGQRSSTLRTFTDFNLRASTFHKPITSYEPPPFFMESNDSANQLGTIERAGSTGDGFTRNLAADPLFWGRSAVTGSTRTVLYSIPRQFTSLAQLQHADLTNDDTTISIAHQPGNAFANSYATPFVKRAVTEQSRTDYEIMGSPNRSGASQTTRSYYDISHILNNCLWDRYFFSTISSGGSVPENPTLVALPGARDLTEPDKAAAGLMIEGAFNVNSTDKKAWKAFLASSNFFEHPADGATFPEAAFPRSLEQPESCRIPPTGSDDDSFSGYRRLTEPELDLLAEELVKQVRLRGPFVSLSHFVNRALENLSTEPELTRSGALQFALDESGVNISLDGRRNGFQRIIPEGRGRSVGDRVTLAAKQGAPRADMDGGDLSNRPQDANPREPDWARTSRDNNFGAVASIVADRELILDPKLKLEQGYRSTGIPGWVTQADVLQVIGPSIAVRSDTFRIRTCGQARDTDGNVIATAYCEAIVQRRPEFSDPANQAHDRPDALVTTNKTYGRQFEMVSFRWLSPREI